MNNNNSNWNNSDFRDYVNYPIRTNSDELVQCGNQFRRRFGINWPVYEYLDRKFLAVLDCQCKVGHGILCLLPMPPDHLYARAAHLLPPLCPSGSIRYSLFPLNHQLFAHHLFPIRVSESVYIVSFISQCRTATHPGEKVEKHFHIMELFCNPLWRVLDVYERASECKCFVYLSQNSSNSFTWSIVVPLRIDRK